jgi:hypothetical protein
MKKCLELNEFYLDLFFNGPFFVHLDSLEIAADEWVVFLMQKYGSVAYFLDFLQKGAELCKPHSEKLSQIFNQNYREEIGFFRGTQRKEYSHETWRLRSLRGFGITPDDLARVELFPSTEMHSKAIAELCKSDDFLEYSGALLFLESFVVREMDELIVAFERTIPELFPEAGYLLSKSPYNIHEYWYNHRAHDVNHFKQIRKGLLDFFAQDPSQAQAYEIRIMSGMAKMSTAKLYLYDCSLLSAMRWAD